MNKISEITRQNIFDYITNDWSGRLWESEFISRIFDLKNMASNDNKSINVADDILKLLLVSNADDGFCSIGAGRGGSKHDMGSIRCDSHNWYIGGSRELKDSNNTYYHIL